MALLESLLSVIAPHTCLLCGKEGGLICVACWPSAASHLPSRCYRCHKLTTDYKTCPSCRSSSKLYRVWVRTDYESAAKVLLHKLKFERAQAAATVVARMTSEVLPSLPAKTIIVPVPTATSRRRQRGYDQAELIAKDLARKAGLDYVTPLHRSSQVRQVGTKRAERLKQLETAFWVDEHRVKGRHVVLVDDVLTTGATLEAAATVLRKAGARRVDAIVFAQA